MIDQSKAIFWNSWSFRNADGIYALLEQHSDADIFCLTEVTDIDAKEVAKNGHNLAYTGLAAGENAAQVDNLAQLRSRFGDSREISYMTADHRKWKCLETGSTFNGVGFGSALLVRHDVAVVDSGHEVLKFDDANIKSRVLQWVVYKKNGTCYLLAHLHGVWIKDNTKGDHEARSRQSLMVRLALVRIKHMYDVEKVIFGGDFNLDINTSALQLMEGDHYRNLIKEFGIENTRTAAYRNFDVEGESMYADYALVSNNVTVHSFAVADGVLASDHAALVVEFS